MNLPSVTFAIFALFSLSCQLAFADCKLVGAGEDSETFMKALETRLAPTGIEKIESLSMPDNMLGLGFLTRKPLPVSKLSVFITELDSKVLLVTGVTRTPVDNSDIERQLIAAAFTLARYSGKPEQTILDHLTESTKSHATASSWKEEFENAAADFTRTGGSLVFEAGKVKCN